jgi:hypothetical protein
VFNAIEKLEPCGAKESEKVLPWLGGFFISAPGNSYESVGVPRGFVGFSGFVVAKDDGREGVLSGGRLLFRFICVEPFRCGLRIFLKLNFSEFRYRYR